MSSLNTIIVHSSIFHADDVFSVALARQINPDIMVVRTVDPEVLKEYVPAVEQGTALMVDVGAAIGQTRFDHHQLDCRRRPLSDGTYHNPETDEDEAIKYCGFGLMWEAFGRTFCPLERAFRKVERDLVIPIDRTDNGQGDNLLSSAIKQFNPTYKEGKAAENDSFWNAEAIAEASLKRYIISANAAAEAEEDIRKSRQLDDGQILVLEEHRPWEAFVAEEMPLVKWCIYPSGRNKGRWNLQKAPLEPGSKIGRCKFPQEWCGNPPTERGMTFCHIGNWLAEIDTLEHAVAIARYCIAEQKKEDAYEFLLNGYHRKQVLTTAGNIHLLVENEEYVWVWADGFPRKSIGWYDNGFNGPFLLEKELREYVWWHYQA